MLRPSLLKLTAAIAVLSTVAAVAAGAYAYYLRGEASAAAAAVTTLSEANQRLQERVAKDQATLASLERRRSAIARESASLRRALAHALLANPAWANEPVPKEVQDAITQP
jgi:hypothetical protein